MTDSKDKKTTAGKAKTASGSKAKATATEATQSVAKSALTTSTLPTAADLKDRFKAGSIPLQTDFADLIDMANIGRLAVGDNGTGWGLNKDGQGRLQWDFRQIYHTSYDLSPSASIDRICISNQFSGETSIHNRIALLAINQEIGPTRAVGTPSGNSTTFVCKAIKTDTKGKKTTTEVNIIAKKAVGKTGEDIPFEYVAKNNASYSIWYQFTLNAPDVDLNTCTLVIDPLMLSINHVTDVSKDPFGEVLSLMIVNFTCNSAHQIIPKGLISMFSGSKVPEGWLFCDGMNGTPNLIDRFILGGYVEDNGKKNNITLSGDKTSKTFSAQTNTVTPSINVTVAGHALTVNEMPSHNHSLSGTSHTGGVHLAFDCHVDGGYAGSATTSSAGGGAAHNHSASAKQDAHGHSIDIAVPYYILAFIMKS